MGRKMSGGHLVRADRSADHDPIRHGRFTIIVEQRENAFIKQNKWMLLKWYPKFDYSVLDTMIFITIGSVLEV